MKTIPASILTHTVMLYDVATDEYMNETDKIVAVLEHVRIEPSSSLIVDANGADVQIAATMYVDARISTPQRKYINVGQALMFDGERYRVADVQRFYDHNRLHHQEVVLIDG